MYMILYWLFVVRFQKRQNHLQLFAFRDSECVGLLEDDPEKFQLNTNIKHFIYESTHFVTMFGIFQAIFRHVTTCSICLCLCVAILKSVNIELFQQFNYRKTLKTVII